MVIRALASSTSRPTTMMMMMGKPLLSPWSAPTAVCTRLCPRVLACQLSTKAPPPGKAKGGKDKKDGGAGGKEATASVPLNKDKSVAPVNIYKDGKDPPILPDDQYPEWLFNIRPLTLPEYRQMDISTLPLREQRRYWKLLNRRVIKESKAQKAKF